MCRFIKSKVGFTLVELMVVVAILSVLIAVAVPLYSAATANARKETCVANQRDIVLQLNNYATANQLAMDGIIMITSTSEGMDSLFVDIIATDKKGVEHTFDEETFENLFQEMPYCPGEGFYDISVENSGVGVTVGAVKVTVTCDGNIDGKEHK